MESPVPCETQKEVLQLGQGFFFEGNGEAPDQTVGYQFPSSSGSINIDQAPGPWDKVLEGCGSKLVLYSL